MGVAQNQRVTLFSVISSLPRPRCPRKQMLKGKRSLVETAMGRYKGIIGARLRSYRWRQCTEWVSRPKLVFLLIRATTPSGAVDDNHAARLLCFGRQNGRPLNCAFGGAAEVRDRYCHVHHSRNRNHEALGLVQGQLEDLADQHGGLDCMIEIFLPSAPCACLVGSR
jgi:hypothetical protein